MLRQDLMQEIHMDITDGNFIIGQEQCVIHSNITMQKSSWIVVRLILLAGFSMSHESCRLHSAAWERQLVRLLQLISYNKLFKAGRHSCLLNWLQSRRKEQEARDAPGGLGSSMQRSLEALNQMAAELLLSEFWGQEPLLHRLAWLRISWAHTRYI